jgi:two-component system NarL family response regulator
MEYLDSLPRVRVLVLHKESIVAHGLCAALGSQPELEVQQGAGSVSNSNSFDVVVCDYDTGLALASPCRARNGIAANEASRVMVLTAHASEQSVRLALERGVHGYVLLDSPIDEVVRGVRAVSLGQRFMSHAVAQRMADSLTHETMTVRENEVLLLLAAGQCNKSIARQLQIAVGTVKAHVKSIMGKLNANSRTQAVSVAALRGLVGLTADTSHMASVRAASARQTNATQLAR